MGKKDVAVKNWIKDKVRFTDLFNGVCFSGAQVIKPDELVELNGESGLMFYDKQNTLRYAQRYRDVVMLWNGILLRVALATELQDKIHYAMPVKNMFMDALSYTDQIRELWANMPEDEKKQLIGSDDYFSRFRKEDKLYPIITLVFYWGESWDGNMELYDMFDLSGAKNDENIINTLHKYVPNYHINLVHPNVQKDLSVFKTDLQKMMGVIQYSSNKEKLLQYVNDNRDYFGYMDYDSATALKALLGSKKLSKKNFKNEGENDMCKALEDLYNDGVEKGKQAGHEAGRKEGHEAGRKEERANGITKLVKVLKSLGLDKNQILNSVIEEYNITEAEALSYIQ